MRRRALPRTASTMLISPVFSISSIGRMKLQEKRIDFNPRWMKLLRSKRNP
jgi:hypothetical protein